MKNIKKNNITSKIALMGFVQIIVPTAVLILLLSIAFLKLKNVNQKYEDIVQGLHKDISEIDKNLTRYNSTLRKNKNKIHNVNKKFGLAQLKIQMKYSSLELLLRLSEYYKSKINISSQELYKLYLKNQTLQNKPLSFAQNINTEDRDTTINQPTKIPDSKDNPESTQEKKIRNLKDKLAKTMKFLTLKEDKVLFELFDKFSKETSLGFRHKTIFFLGHEGLHQHRIIWSNKHSYINKNLEDLNDMRHLKDSIANQEYMRNFLAFQLNQKPVKILKKLMQGDVSQKVKAQYTKAKYNFSKQQYIALIPVWGTNFSLGLSTSLDTQDFMALDSIKDSLATLNKYLHNTTSKINEVDDSTLTLARNFKDEIDNFGQIFLILIGICLVFVVIITALIIRSIKKNLVNPILHLTKVSQDIENGNFSTRSDIHTNDELEKLSVSINNMLDKIVFLIQSDEERQRIQSDILTLLEAVSMASKGDLTVRRNVATDQLQAVIDAFNHMISSIGSLVINVRQSGESVEKTAKDMLESLEGILDKAHKQNADLDVVSRKIKALGDKSQEITRMVEQIGSIANETNTLALNASLEASRSGEQDSGISHLAEHVRQLANGLDKTKQDIESFIGSIQLATNYAVKSVEEVLELTRATEKEADNSFKTARKTYEEAERLTQSISLFKVKTQKDREREEELKATVNNILNTIRRTRKLVLAMDTQEFNQMNEVLDSFENRLANMNLLQATDSAGENPLSKREKSERDIPAIVENDDDNDDNDKNEDKTRELKPRKNK